MTLHSLRLALAKSAALLLMLVGSTVFADDYPKKMNFQNIMHNKDIALGEVEAILQDHEGFIWLGGRNGLLRYDGYEFDSVAIRMDARKPEDLTQVNQVVDLYEDSRNELWAATRSGLFKYDRDEHVLVKLEQQNGEPLPAYSDTVNRVVEAPTGEILAGAYAGLNIIDPATLNAQVLMHDPEDAKSLANDVIHDIHISGDVIWIGTDAGLTRMEWPSKKMTHYLPYPSNASSLPDNAVWVIDEDRSGELWIGVHSGIYRFNPKTASFIKYQNDAADRFSLAGNITRDIFVDSNGWVWTGSDQHGISLYDKENDRFIRYQHQAGKPGTLSGDSIRRIYEDRVGDLWVGTYPNGVNFHDRSTAAITVYSTEADRDRGLLTHNIAAVTEDKDGNLWIGGGGVSRFNREDDSFTHYTPNANGQSGIDSNSIISGHIDRDGDIWFGTWAAGYHRYNPSTDRFEQMPFDATLARNGQTTSKVLNDNVVWNIYQDRRKNLWLSTHNGGLSKYDKATDSYTVYQQTSSPDSISNQLVWVTYEDSQDRFWVGTASGLNLMDRDKGTFKHYRSDDSDPSSLANNSILSIYEDSKGRVWFGSDAGLHLYHPETDNFSVFNGEDGFNDSGIRSIIGDKNGALWLGTNNGVVMFHPDSKEVKNFKSYNGEKIGGMSTGAALASSKGEMIFGGLAGMRIFDVNKLGKNEVEPPVVITDFKIFTKPVPINGPEGILNKVINQTNQLTLDYKKAMFSFNFAALNYRDSDKNQYAYKLEGFDKDWREVGNQRSALYTNLDAGNYTFKVKASNNDGVWNEQAKSVQIRQLPPPWRTWWAHTIYALIILALIAWFVQAQRRKRQLIEEQNRVLEKKVLERTSELREKNDDIQAMLSNMRQGLFTVEPTGFVHPEYSRFLEDIFEEQNLAGRDAVELLFDKAQLGGDSLDQAKEAIGSIIGEDEMNFAFNSHLLPEEYEVDFDGGKKYLALDWNPILSNDTVVKLMVSVRDVTQLKQMESEAQSKKRELDIISQLLNVPSKKYLAFAESAKKFIAENREKVAANPSRSDDVIALLFRNMHTIKGNCRTFGFSHFSDVVHSVESTYSELKADSQIQWQQEVLLKDLDRVDAILGEYENVYYTVLGRGDSSGSSRDDNGFWADGAAVSAIQKCIDAVEADHAEVSKRGALAPIKRVLEAALSGPLSEVLVDIVDSLPSIAGQLGKAPPQVQIDDQNIRIKKTGHELVNNVFAHILRNCVDHGIEPPAVRESAGKTAEGKIELYPLVKNGSLEIHVRDDGQGLDVERLFQKGVALGKWKESDDPALSEIAELIFASGVSTKEQVSDISGRGVGMDAVKQFLLASGGTIRLDLNVADGKTRADCNVPFLPFELLVVLPEKLFCVSK